jgi:LPS-assembly lipoprotein
MLRRSFLGSLVLLPLSLTGCGFQLRGATQLPPEYSPIYVHSRPGSRIGPALVQALYAAGTELARDRADARSLVRILLERHQERVTAVDSNGKVIGIELGYRVAFDAVTVDGVQLAKRQSLVLTREYVNPDIEVIAKAEEAQLIRRDLIADMADHILRRLRAQLL